MKPMDSPTFSLALPLLCMVNKTKESFTVSLSKKKKKRTNSRGSFSSPCAFQSPLLCRRYLLNLLMFVSLVSFYYMHFDFSLSAFSPLMLLSREPQIICCLVSSGLVAVIYIDGNALRVSLFSHHFRKTTLL